MWFSSKGGGGGEKTDADCRASKERRRLMQTVEPVKEETDADCRAVKVKETDADCRASKGGD